MFLSDGAERRRIADVLVVDLPDRLVIGFDGRDFSTKERVQLIDTLIHGSRCHWFTSGRRKCNIRSEEKRPGSALEAAAVPATALERMTCALACGLLLVLSEKEASNGYSRMDPFRSGRRDRREAHHAGTRSGRHHRDHSSRNRRRLDRRLRRPGAPPLWAG